MSIQHLDYSSLMIKKQEDPRAFIDSSNRTSPIQTLGMKVLIIGGGVGGLCLAHGLLKTGIEVQVFEQQVRVIDAKSFEDIH
jgi:pyruvate/2-oxoglutarate dehydrogenase complex dihydrolipoamide dehydrogenase (E3) component